MAASEVTIEATYGVIPVQDNAPTYKICAGIDTLHALGDASRACRLRLRLRVALRHQEPKRLVALSATSCWPVWLADLHLAP